MILPLAFGMVLMWIFRTVHRAAKDELSNERRNIRVRLSELYGQVERGEISEEQFDAKEKVLLDRLDALREQGRG